MSNKLSFRIIPRVRFINYRKGKPSIGKDIFQEWFAVDRGWGGRIVDIRCKHFALSFDFRGNWLSDMANFRAPKKVK